MLNFYSFEKAQFKITILISILLTILFSSSKSYAQSYVFNVEGETISLLNANRTLVSGTSPGFAVGSVHRFDNILTIDGRVLYCKIKVVSTTNATIVTFDDDTPGTGLPQRF